MICLTLGLERLVILSLKVGSGHLSYLPHSGTVLSGLEPDQIEGLEATKGALKFPVETPPSDELVADLIQARVVEVSGSPTKGVAR